MKSKIVRCSSVEERTVAFSVKSTQNDDVTLVVNKVGSYGGFDDCALDRPPTGVGNSVNNIHTVGA